MTGGTPICGNLHIEIIDRIEHILSLFSHVPLAVWHILKTIFSWKIETLWEAVLGHGMSWRSYVRWPNSLRRTRQHGRWCPWSWRRPSRTAVSWNWNRCVPGTAGCSAGATAQIICGIISAVWHPVGPVWAYIIWYYLIYLILSVFIYEVSLYLSKRICEEFPCWAAVPSPVRSAFWARSRESAKHQPPHQLAKGP